MIKCRFCGKELVGKGQKMFCSNKCAYRQRTKEGTNIWNEQTVVLKGRYYNQWDKCFENPLAYHNYETGERYCRMREHWDKEERA